MSEGTVRVCLICSKCLDKPSSARLCCLPAGVIWPLSIYVCHMTQHSVKKREREKKDIKTQRAKHLNSVFKSSILRDKFQSDIVTESDGTLQLKRNTLCHICNSLTIYCKTGFEEAGAILRSLNRVCIIQTPENVQL